MVMMMLLSLFIVVMQKQKQKKNTASIFNEERVKCLCLSAKFKSQNRILVHDMMMIKPIFMCNKPVKKKPSNKKKIHEQNTREAS